MAERASANGAAFALCNMVGGQDELVFDGASVVVGPDGQTLARAAQFAPELLVCDLMLPPDRSTVPPLRGASRFSPSSLGRAAGGPRRAALADPLPDEESEVYAALTRACATTSRRTASSTS